MTNSSHNRHQPEPSNVISFPSNDSFKKGAEYALIAVEGDLDYMLAYSIAIADSVLYQKPADYIRGFMTTYRAEEEKRMMA